MGTRVYLLPHAIEQSAERDPGRDAFRFQDQALTYEALLSRSGKLATLLADQGAARGDRVGVFMNKCLEMPVSVYGIMRAGAAFVPLDPLAPVDRLAGMVRHCGIRHLVTHPAKRAQVEALLGEDTPLECVVGIADLDAPGTRQHGWSALAGAAERPPSLPGSMEQDLAYIMYTSGSTGIPKGIMHSHHSGMSYARMSARTYGVTAEDRLGNHSPLHFDMSTFEFLSGPLAGATTVLIPEPYTKLPASLSELIEREALTFWYSVPFALIQLHVRGALEQRDLTSLRWVLFGGEPFPPKYLAALMRQWPHARFSNVYGPAEVNQCSFFHVPAGAVEALANIPIGRIWENAEGLVVDDADRPVAAGEAGELVVRTPTMMRGYWSAPELNARAFYERRVTEDVSDRFYRTGDLVVQRPDGELEFLGRKDRQIKVRGHRVELDEIEAIFAAHPQVEEAAAYGLAEDDEGAGLSIRVEVTTTADSHVEPAELRQHAARGLPRYAVPDGIRIVNGFPRTTSGKIDRARLRAAAQQSLND